MSKKIRSATVWVVFDADGNVAWWHVHCFARYRVTADEMPTGYFCRIVRITAVRPKRRRK